MASRDKGLADRNIVMERMMWTLAMIRFVSESTLKGRRGLVAAGGELRRYSKGESTMSGNARTCENN